MQFGPVIQAIPVIGTGEAKTWTDLDGVGDTVEPTPSDLDGNPWFVDDAATGDSGVPDSPDYPDPAGLAGAVSGAPSGSRRSRRRLRLRS